MSAQARREFYFGRIEAPEEWLSKVEAVSPAEIETVAEEIFSDHCLSLSIVGDVRNVHYSGADLAQAIA